MYSDQRQRKEGEGDESEGIEALLMLSNQNQWKITKKLTKSDVTPEQNRLLIGKSLVQEHVLPHLDKRSNEQVHSDNGLSVRVRDADDKGKSEAFRLKFKWWKSSECFVFIQGWTNDFVHRRGLNKGDVIGMFWYGIDEVFVFSVLQRAPPPDLSATA